MKKRILMGAAVAAALTVAVLGCQTAKPALVAPAESAIQVEKSGFSPAAAAGQNSIEISMLLRERGSNQVLEGGGGRAAAAQKTWTR